MGIQNVTIPTRTTVTTTASTIEIFVEYFPDGSLGLMFFVALTDRIVEGVSFIAGDLGYTYQNVNDMFEINDAGDLIINALDPTQYSIDDAGDLIFTS